MIPGFASHLGCWLRLASPLDPGGPTGAMVTQKIKNESVDYCPHCVFEFWKILCEEKMDIDKLLEKLARNTRWDNHKTH